MTEHPLDNFDALALRNELTAARMSQLVRRISRRAVDVDQAAHLAELRPLRDTSDPEQERYLQELWIGRC